MASVSIKSGVNGASLVGLKPEMSFAFVIIVVVFLNENVNCKLSSGSEGKHSRGSLHYSGLAIDVSSRGVPKKKRSSITRKLSLALGDEFDVVFEGNHWHIEYQPKTRK